jgi:hypothetical protein
MKFKITLPFIIFFKNKTVLITVDAPTAKAAKSVIDVMVMLTPACLIVIPIRLGSDLFESSLLRLFQPVPTKKKK